jgi:dolichol kinase
LVNLDQECTLAFKNNKCKGFIMDLSKKLRIIIRLIHIISEVLIVLEDEVSKTERERTNEKDNGHSYFSSYYIAQH